MRNRVILTDELIMKKVLFVAFQVSDSSSDNKSKEIFGIVSCGGKKLGEYSLKCHEGRYGNLIFDLPYDIPDGEYYIEIGIQGHSKVHARDSVRINKSDLRSSIDRKKKIFNEKLEEITQPVEKEKFTPLEDAKKRGYITFSRSPLEYVFPGTRPKKEEVIDSFSLMIARDEFEPLTFSLYPVRDLGLVTVSVSDLVSSAGAVLKSCVEVGYVDEVDSTVGMPNGKYQKVPRLIRPTNKVEVKKGRCKRFWVTIRVGPLVVPGIYISTICIDPQYGEKRLMPLRIEVVPITLTDIPGIDYFMLMTYEFTELTMPWNKNDKEKIYTSALNVLRDYKDHGMTTLCPHSPFVLKLNEDGSPYMADFYANLLAARDMGFTRPIVWYMGHLISTAKSRHPGNINSFDKAVEMQRLKWIVQQVKRFVEENNCPEVIFLPIDEPDDRYSDPSGQREKITPLLLKTIHEMGGKTMVTSRTLTDNMDIICSSKLDKGMLLEAHKTGKRYLIYNNAVTTASNNPAYARYKYGLYVWKEAIDGMTSWTFQMTQNARGRPGVVDSGRDGVYLAYPDPDGPLTTLHWEAIREGIDDHKLIYQLKQRVRALNLIGQDSRVYQSYLLALKKAKGEPGLHYEEFSEFNPDYFQSTRNRLMSLILDADRKLAKM